MSLKNLPVRAPTSKVLPRKRSVGERIVATLELAALVRTLSRVLGRRKRSRLPSRGGLLAIVGGSALAALIVLLAKRKSGADDTPSPQPAPTESAKPAETKPEPEEKPAPEEKPVPAPAAQEKPEPVNDTAADHVPDSDPVPAAVEAAKTLDGKEQA